MKIKKAYRQVLDPDKFRWSEYDVEWTHDEVFDGFKTSIIMRERESGDARMPTHEVRRYSDEIEDGCEGERLVDWHEVYDGTLRFIGGSLYLTGFSRGPKAHEGNHNDHGYDLDEGTPWQRVEWRFTL